MSRVATRLIVSLFASAALGPALAADWPMGNEPSFRPAYPVDTYPMDDSLDFEAGLRYFYGMGGQRSTITPFEYSADDSSQFLEAHIKIEDHSTDTYVQANVGYAAAIDGSYRTPTSNGLRKTSLGTIAYGGADFGYLPVKTDSFALGGFIGYQYLNESMFTGRSPFMTSSGGGNSDPNLLEVHGLRLGATARADLNDMFDIRIDAAAIPYASLSGTNGAFDLRAADPTAIQGNAPQISGHLYGGAVEAMVGFKPQDNFAIRAGLRGYYLTGPTQTYVEVRDPNNLASAQGYDVTGNVELFRWGPVIELTGRF